MRGTTLLACLSLAACQVAMAAGGNAPPGDGTPAPVPPGEASAAADAPPAPARFTTQLDGTVRLRLDGEKANPIGPAADANRWVPGIVNAASDRTALETELHTELRSGQQALVSRMLLSAGKSSGGSAYGKIRFNELFGSWAFGEWHASLGRKVVSWDVGQAFRPNDLVQREDRRQLIPRPLRGVPMVQLERFGADAALSLVLANPDHADDSLQAQGGHKEASLNARAYWRAGGADMYGFARYGRHTGASLGSAVALVAGDEVELHGSARWFQRRQSWATSTSSTTALLQQNPWQIDLQGAGGQGLVGGSWTGASQQSVLLEWWYDGTAPSDAQWRQWGARNAALRASAPLVPVAAAAGNLAYQATPLGGLFGNTALRRNNLLLRLAWQTGSWQFAFDTLVTPADRGRVFTASLRWQGDRTRVDLALRRYGGPAGSVFAQLPVRRQAAATVSWSF